MIGAPSLSERDAERWKNMSGRCRGFPTRIRWRAAAGTTAVVLLLLVLWPPAQALPPERALGSFTLSTWEEGLPQNTVLALAQTPDGYLRLGTYEGLVRFDGIRFVVFNRTNTPAFSNGNEIFALAIDARGRLWIAGSGHVSVLERGRIEPMIGAAERSDEAVRSLTIEGDRSWVGTSGQLLQLDLDGSVLQRFQAGTDYPNSVVRSLLADEQGGVWAGFESGELIRAGSTGIQRIAVDGPPARTILALARSPEGELWIGTEGGGLLQGTGPDRRRLTVEDGLGDDRVQALHYDPDGTLWIATDGGGISRLIDGRLSNLTTMNGLPSDQVRSLLTDREGGLWIGTNGGGVAALQDKPLSSFNRKDGLATDNVRAVLEDRTGAIWAGTDGGGLYRLTDELVRFGPEAGLPSVYVKAIHEDRGGRIWVGTAGGGLSRFEDGRFVSLTSADGLSSDNVYAIQHGADGSLWVGSNFGVDRIDPDGAVTSYGREQGFLDGHVTDLLLSAARELPGVLPG